MYKLFLINGTTQIVESKSNKKYPIDEAIKQTIKILKHKYKLGYNMVGKDEIINNINDKVMLELVTGAIIFTSDKDYIKKVIQKFYEENKVYVNIYLIDDFDKSVRLLIDMIDSIEKEYHYFMFRKDIKLKGTLLDKLDEEVLNFLVKTDEGFDLIYIEGDYFHGRYGI